MAEAIGPWLAAEMASSMQTPGGPEPDMIVLGGGPAGAVSAWLAARDGLSVWLVDPERPLDRIEGLSPRLHRWLSATGIGTGGSVAGPLPRRIDWAGQSEGANGEFLVRRGAFDAHLRAAACAAGARPVRATGRIGTGGIILSDGSRPAPRWTLDARGRAAGRRRSPHPAPAATLSLCGWAIPAGRVEPGLTISALPEGWLWSGALPGGPLWAQFTCDARGDGPPEARLRAALAAARPGIGGAAFAGPVNAREAAPVLPSALDSLSCLPVGDALAAMDPLSGHGLFWAVSSALAAAAVRRTLAARPGAKTEALCRRYLESRALETALRNARIGRDFIRQETRFADAPFWAARRGFPDDVPGHEPLAAPATGTGFVLKDGLVEEREILRTPRSPQGIGWFGNVSAPALWREWQGCADREAFRRRWGPAGEALLAEIG